MLVDRDGSPPLRLGGVRVERHGRAEDREHVVGHEEDRLTAGDRRLELWVMAEVPSVVYRIPEYAALGIDGVSIGSNDLTQLMLGVDRDTAVRNAARDFPLRVGGVSTITRSKRL